MEWLYVKQIQANHSFRARFLGNYYLTCGVTKDEGVNFLNISKKLKTFYNFSD